MALWLYYRSADKQALLVTPTSRLTFLQYRFHVLNKLDGAGTRKLKRVLRSVSKMRFPCPSISSPKHSICRYPRKKFGEFDGTSRSQTRPVRASTSPVILEKINNRSD